jgi:hypothetical protein
VLEPAQYSFSGSSRDLYTLVYVDWLKDAAVMAELALAQPAPLPEDYLSSGQMTCTSMKIWLHQGLLHAVPMTSCRCFQHTWQSAALWMLQ